MNPSTSHRFVAPGIRTAMELSWIPVNRPLRFRLQAALKHYFLGTPLPDDPANKVNAEHFDQALALFARHAVEDARTAFELLGYRVTVRPSTTDQGNP